MTRHVRQCPVKRAYELRVRRFGLESRASGSEDAHRPRAAVRPRAPTPESDNDNSITPSIQDDEVSAIGARSDVSSSPSQEAQEALDDMLELPYDNNNLGAPMIGPDVETIDETLQDLTFITPPAAGVDETQQQEDDHDDNGSLPSTDESTTDDQDSNAGDQDSNASIQYSSGRLSTSGITNGFMEPFKHDAAIGPMQAGVGRQSRSSDRLARRSDDLFGFDSDIDIAIARWMHTERISANAIDRLLKDAQAEELTTQLSWKSGVELKFKLSQMHTEAKIGDWHRDTFTLQGGLGPVVYHLRYRRVVDAVRFFLGHEGFKDDLVYAPYRAWTEGPNARRVYDEMASGDWWWNTQVKLNRDGATIVPLIIASDKTLVTNHQGDLAAHAVYLTVGNLRMSARHANKRPGSILLALLPIVKDGDNEHRNRVFHECFGRLFDPIKRISDAEGMDVVCADGLTRHCFPVISAFTVDYEEQVKLTGVKSGSHCSMCHIHPDKREDLEEKAPWRTHEDTQRQITLQRLSRVNPKDAEYVHDFDCFAFGHRHVNVHKAMMVDILHQLLKGLLMHVLKWIDKLLLDQTTLQNSKRLRVVVESTRKQGKRKNTQTVAQERIVDMIDRRFLAMPKYPGMRRFTHFSKVTQWTGNEQKSILRQMLPVFTPLLQDIKATEAIRFTRAVVDFIILAMYPSHDDDTLRYLELALCRLNAYKEIFRTYRLSKKATNELNEEKEGHFNFPKWHVLSHYVDMIKDYGSARGYDTNHPEHSHVVCVKDAFKNTNKKIGWEDQVMDYNRRMLNTETAFDYSKHYRQLTHAEMQEEEAPPVTPTSAVDVVKVFGWPSEDHDTHELLSRQVRTVEEVMRYLDHDDGEIFQHAVAVFLREAQGLPRQTGRQDGPTSSDRESREGSEPRGDSPQTHGPRTTQHCRGSQGGPRNASGSSHDPDTLDDDPSWVNGYNVKFHASLRCHKETGADPENISATKQDFVRCSPDWQGIKGNARYDWLWVQEFQGRSADEAGPDIALQGRLPVQLRHVLTLYHPETPKRQYMGVYVDIARPKDRLGLPDEIHGMVVIKRIPPALKQRPRALGGRRIYPLTGVYYSIHVIPVDETYTGFDGEMYINNTSDWDTYNRLYDIAWEEKEAVNVANTRRVHDQRRRDRARASEGQGRARDGAQSRQSRVRRSR